MGKRFYGEKVRMSFYLDTPVKPEYDKEEGTGKR